MQQSPGKHECGSLLAKKEQYALHHLMKKKSKVNLVEYPDDLCQLNIWKFCQECSTRIHNCDAEHVFRKNLFNIVIYLQRSVLVPQAWVRKKPGLARRHDENLFCKWGNRMKTNTP